MLTTFSAGGPLKGGRNGSKHLLNLRDTQRLPSVRHTAVLIQIFLLMQYTTVTDYSSYHSKDTEDWIRWGGMEAYVSKASAGEVDLKRPKYQKVCTTEKHSWEPNPGPFTTEVVALPTELLWDC